MLDDSIRCYRKAPCVLLADKSDVQCLSCVAQKLAGKPESNGAAKLAIKKKQKVAQTLSYKIWQIIINTPFLNLCVHVFGVIFDKAV